MFSTLMVNWYCRLYWMPYKGREFFEGNRTMVISYVSTAAINVFSVIIYKIIVRTIQMSKKYFKISFCKNVVRTLTR
jgi:hypothetical protein